MTFKLKEVLFQIRKYMIRLSCLILIYNHIFYSSNESNQKMKMFYTFKGAFF